MDSAPIPPGYGPAVRATMIWAVATATWAALVAAPFALAGLGFLVEGLVVTRSAGEVVGGLVLSSLVGLGLLGVVRCVVASTARVRGAPGYPDRHWWFVRRAFRSLLATELVLLAAGAGLTALAVFGHGRPADLAEPVAALALGGVVFFPLLALLGLDGVLRHASVVPYFPRAVGGIETFGHGESLARHVAELDAVAGSLGVTPLSAFGWNDDLEREPLVWHEASEGLDTINTLLAFLESEEADGEDHADTVADLKRLSQALARAEAQGIPFSLLLRHATVTNHQEWVARRGTCF